MEGDRIPAGDSGVASHRGGPACVDHGGDRHLGVLIAFGYRETSPSGQARLPVVLLGAFMGGGPHGQIELVRPDLETEHGFGVVP